MYTLVVYCGHCGKEEEFRIFFFFFFAVLENLSWLWIGNGKNVCNYVGYKIVLCSNYMCCILF